MRYKIFVSFIPLFASLKVFSVENTKKNETIIATCKVAFSSGKATFNEKILADCIDEIKNKEVIRYISIIASASPDGNDEFNQRLTDRRVETIANFVQEKFPIVPIKTTSIGKNKRYGRKGVIQFVSVSVADNSALLSQLSAAENERKRAEELLRRAEEKAAREREEAARAANAKNKQNFPNPLPAVAKKQTPVPLSAHFSIRIGRDIFMRDVQAPYFAIGAEAALEYQANENLRYEIAIQGSRLTNDKVLTLYNLYAAPGIYYTNSGFVIGARGLLGGIANQNKQIGGDFGGEVRAGYEFKAFTVMLDAGRTSNTARFGVNFGLKL